jgi:thiosulfate reductase cytochrome b subunit
MGATIKQCASDLEGISKADSVTNPVTNPLAVRHTRWVRITHWIATASFLTLAVSGFVILMSHPRLYWGEAGNDLTTPLLELPISKNYRHGGWEKTTPIFEGTSSPVSASRTFEIFNQNGWGRSLHFLAAWFFAATGAAYLLMGIGAGHFRRHLVPRAADLAPGPLWQDFKSHLRLQIRAPTGGPQYGLLQKCTYSAVVFVALPLTVITGLAMSPALNAAYPFLSGMFGGLQSARTIHFFAFVLLVLFLLVHLVMIIKSGFKPQMRAMTVGE